MVKLWRVSCRQFGVSHATVWKATKSVTTNLEGRNLVLSKNVYMYIPGWVFSQAEIDSFRAIRRGSLKEPGYPATFLGNSYMPIYVGC